MAAGATAGPTILDALRDRRLFGGLPAFRDLKSWDPWMTALGSSYGLPLTQDQQERFCRHTGRSRYAPPPGGWKESVFVVGRQSGKTTAASVIVAYEAAFGRVERGTGHRYALLVAQDHRAVLRTIFSYICEIFANVPVLAQTVRDRKADSLLLRNGMKLAAYPCRPASVRGLRAQVVVADELGFFTNSEGNPQDTAMLRAARPTLATTDGRLIILSSPAGQQGALYDLFERHYGHDDSPVLIWQASAPDMNPTLSADYLVRMEQNDPEGYRSEVLGEFEPGPQCCSIPTLFALASSRGVSSYDQSMDVFIARSLMPAGGRRDAFTCAVGHRYGDIVVLDAIRVWRAPFNPSSVVAECSRLLSSYHVTTIRGDGFAAEWVAESFRLRGVSYEESPLPPSELYLEMLPAVNAGQVALLDLKELSQELLGLERRRGPSGRDRIVHPASRLDDIANAVAGLVHMLVPKPARMFDGYQYTPQEQFDPQQMTLRAPTINELRLLGFW